MSGWQYHWDEDGERCMPPTHRKYASHGDQMISFGWNEKEPDLTNHDKLHEANRRDEAALRAIASQERAERKERARANRHGIQ